MLNPEEWRWLEDHLRGDFEHLLIGTSDPLILAPALHYAERWGEAVARGAWGGAAARQAEKLRRAADLDHWPAFGESFDRLTGLLARVGAGAYGHAAGLDHGALGGRPPRLPGGGRLPAFRRGPQQRLAGGLLAVSQRARQPRAQDDRPRRHARSGRGLPHPRPARRSAAGAGALAAGRGAVLRQPGGDADPRRPLGRAQARAHDRRPRDRRSPAAHSFERPLV